MHVDYYIGVNISTVVSFRGECPAAGIECKFSWRVMGDMPSPPILCVCIHVPVCYDALPFNHTTGSTHAPTTQHSIPLLPPILPHPSHPSPRAPLQPHDERILPALMKKYSRRQKNAPFPFRSVLLSVPSRSVPFCFSSHFARFLAVPFRSVPSGSVRFRPFNSGCTRLEARLGRLLTAPRAYTFICRISA